MTEKENKYFDEDGCCKGCGSLCGGLCGYEDYADKKGKEKENEWNDLSQINWLLIGSTEDFSKLKEEIGDVCRDVTRAGCIDEICINDIVMTFKRNGFLIVKAPK